MEVERLTKNSGTQFWGYLPHGPLNQKSLKYPIFVKDMTIVVVALHRIWGLHQFSVIFSNSYLSLSQHWPTQSWRTLKYNASWSTWNRHQSTRWIGSFSSWWFLTLFSLVPSSSLFLNEQYLYKEENFCIEGRTFSSKRCKFSETAHVDLKFLHFLISCIDSPQAADRKSRCTSNLLLLHEEPKENFR